jgi:DNA-binding CsgD family transcriptional regulator
MSLHRLVDEFGMRSRACTNGDDLFALTEAAAREIHFPRLALVHGLWFRRKSARLIRMDNFGEWADIFIESEYYTHDPALLVCQRTNTAFPWTAIPQLLPSLTSHQKMILGEASRHGLRNGITVPIGVAGEPFGCCSFSCDKAILPSRWHCRAAALIGAEAFREARRIHGFPARSKQLPRLSDRKLECLELLTIGKTDEEIAQILGIAVSTVRTYMTMLRQDFDVVSRTQLAVEALRFGLVNYDDAIL